MAIHLERFSKLRDVNVAALWSQFLPSALMGHTRQNNFSNQCRKIPVQKSQKTASTRAGNAKSMMTG